MPSRRVCSIMMCKLCNVIQCYAELVHIYEAVEPIAEKIAIDGWGGTIYSRQRLLPGCSWMTHW